MKKIALFFINWTYQVYSCDKQDYPRQKPFDVFQHEGEEHYWESGVLRAAFSLLLIFAK